MPTFPNLPYCARFFVAWKNPLPGLLSVPNQVARKVRLFGILHFLFTAYRVSIFLCFLLVAVFYSHKLFARKSRKVQKSSLGFIDPTIGNAGELLEPTKPRNSGGAPAERLPRRTEFKFPFEYTNGNTTPCFTSHKLE